jgi:hypothetical protein
MSVRSLSPERSDAFGMPSRHRRAALHDERLGAADRADARRPPWARGAGVVEVIARHANGEFDPTHKTTADHALSDAVCAWKAAVSTDG